jgi:hypothetical protein
MRELKIPQLLLFNMLSNNFPTNFSINSFDFFINPKDEEIHTHNSDSNNNKNLTENS